ncbi:MAG: bifunctional diaminohydroxyphosphoribosylaminopyrimidine deaminase/5-amino-6-(5-phosphoribosylamino)uracil reductase RibD [Desulfitobacteriia bacterium]|jgi:diaminohydroxyphosphoribosylaminopyrimidine deaminase/5-amino-6-(5-phosphoribosylamino)uracil reductase
MKNNPQDEFFMQRALDLSLLAAGRTSPNPLVGCVIVKNNEIVGEGFHAKAGTPHAEIVALQAASEQAMGADVYVTLEPCSHYGRTPPCTEALIKAAVKRVIVAMPDPNPLVNGRGLKKLKEAGIEVEVGLLAKKAGRINESFIKAVTHKIPFVLYKSALTLDGKTAVRSGDSKWITSEGARQYVHNLRNTYDVVMVGSGTVLQDDPQLTCRNIMGGRNPVRLIVDGSLRVPLEAQVLNPEAGLCILATTNNADRVKMKELEVKENVEIWQYDTERYVPLDKLMKDVAARGLNSILLEGGGTLAGKMLEQQLIDKIEFIFAPKVVGLGPVPFSGFQLSKMNDAVRVKDLDFSPIDGNYIVSGYLDYN